MPEHTQAAKPNVSQDQQDAVISALSRFIAQDVTTSLRLARINLGNLERSVEDGNRETTYRYLESIRARIDAAEHVLERIREYGQIVEFESTPNPVNIPLLVADLERLATGKGFAFECEGPRLEIRTSGVPLRLALTELVRNAVDHHDRPPGRVQVSWTTRADRVTFRVTDDGPGIAGEFRHRIFDFGATLAPRDPRRHAGLGLCIVAHLLTALGQDYGIQSAAQPGRGTTIYMTWPTVWPFGGDAMPRRA